MIEDILNRKYNDCLTGLALTDKGLEIPAGLDVYENTTSLILSKIVVNEECRGNNVGTSIMNDLIAYADSNNQIVALTPSSDFGGNKNRLIQFYKRFGFKHNKGQYKSYEFRETMIRYPKLNENTMKKDIECNKCGWSWDKDDTEAHDMYVCHKCGNDNTIKENKMGGGLLENPKFKVWFGNSKVVDKNGNPLVVYHGTTKDFDSFSDEYKGVRTNHSKEDVGFHFTNDPNYADAYAETSTMNMYFTYVNHFPDEESKVRHNIRNSNLMPLYIKIENPYYIPNAVINKELIEKVKSEGHDGIIGKLGDSTKEYVVFKPTQIKSAIGNSGEYDPNNQNMVAEKEITNKIVNEGGLVKVPTKKEIIEKFKIDSSELDKEIEMGIKIELEHTDSKEMAEKIAMQHLIEMPDYYTRLKKVEKKGEEEWKQKLKESVAKELRKLI